MSIFLRDIYQELKKLGPEQLPHSNKGPMTGIIVMALKLGWEPHSPLEWDTLVGPINLADEWPKRYPEVAESIMAPYWQKASEHYLGKGSEEALDWGGWVRNMNS